MYFMELANKLKARKKEYTCFIRRDKEIFAFSSKNPYFRGEKDFLTVSDVFEKERTKKNVPKATDDAGYITYVLQEVVNRELFSPNMFATYSSAYDKMERIMQKNFMVDSLADLEGDGEWCIEKRSAWANDLPVTHASWDAFINAILSDSPAQLIKE